MDNYCVINFLCKLFKLFFPLSIIRDGWILPKGNLPEANSFLPRIQDIYSRCSLLWFFTKQVINSVKSTEYNACLMLIQCQNPLPFSALEATLRRRKQQVGTTWCLHRVTIDVWWCCFLLWQAWVCFSSLHSLHLESILLSEASQTEKEKYLMISLIYGI